MTSVVCVGCAATHASACWIAPWSAADVGVLVVGMCVPSEVMIAGATPGSGAISTSAFE